MRGEYLSCQRWIRRSSGSSPHAWGILVSLLIEWRCLRFIPTCVGNTGAPHRCRSCGPVHPHMRGEYRKRNQTRHCRLGSSPHAWGIPFLHTMLFAPCRFIPTCVGNTPRQAVRLSRHPVHPHMRGEYLRFFPMREKPRGSSPHAWGIRARMAALNAEVRFIPTCVGNTDFLAVRDLLTAVHPHMRGEYPRLPARLSLESVHPHMRGEYFAAIFPRSSIFGSSPHAWGIHQTIKFHVADDRFIPTCVGNTEAVAALPVMSPVHPHMRGEYPIELFCGLDLHGSSPHAWGIRYYHRRGHDYLRFIPTCVGNTASMMPWLSTRSVHPHMRGEYSSRKHEEFSMVIIAAKIYRSGTA